MENTVVFGWHPCNAFIWYYRWKLRKRREKGYHRLFSKNCSQILLQQERSLQQ